uniref:Uncharacterized protein n=1 Tax=Arundo donax TaxID=35708 RepID=A0A0A8YBW6_ARUDO
MAHQNIRFIPFCYLTQSYEYNQSLEKVQGQYFLAKATTQ